MHKLITTITFTIAALAALTTNAQEARREAGPREYRVTGELSAVAADSITVSQRTDAGATANVITINNQTVILFQTDGGESVRTETGRVVQLPAVRPGTAAELKAGLRVIVTHREGTASLVIVERARPVREGDGERPPVREGEKPPLRDGERPPVRDGDRPREGDRAREIGDLLGRFGGEIRSVEGDALTVVRRGDAGEQTFNLKLDAASKITVETGEFEEVRGEGGDVRRRPKRITGTAADLKAGQRCEGLHKNNVVVSLFAATPRPRGEGERPRVEGERPRDGDRPAGEGDRPRDGDRPRGEGDRPRDGDRPAGEGDRPRDGERPRVEGVRDGDRPRVEGDGEREGSRGEIRQVNGEIVKRDADTLVMLQRGDGGDRDFVLKLSPGLEVLVETEERINAGARGRPQYAAVPGTPADLLPGRRATATVERDLATRIQVARTEEPVRTRGASGDTLAGEILRIEGGRITLGRRVEGAGLVGERTVAIAPDAKVRIHGEPAKADQLQVGQKVFAAIKADTLTEIEVPIDLSKPEGK